jgi:hypothetical protein
VLGCFRRWRTAFERQIRRAPSAHLYGLMAELPNRSVWDLFGDVKAASDETPDCVRPSVLAKSAPVSKNTVYLLLTCLVFIINFVCVIHIF